MDLQTGFKKISKKDVLRTLMISALCVVLMIVCTHITYAAPGAYVNTIKTVLTNFINLLETIFQAVGVVLAIWGFIQLVLAIRNDDPDSKTRATTQAIVGIVLLAIPSLVDSLGLINYIGQ